MTAAALIVADVLGWWAVLAIWPPRILNRRGCEHMHMAGTRRNGPLRCVACGKRFPATIVVDT